MNACTKYANPLCTRHHIYKPDTTYINHIRKPDTTFM